MIVIGKRMKGGVLIGVLMIAVVMSLFALTFAYIINEKINIISTFNQMNQKRKIAYQNLDKAEKLIKLSPLNLIVKAQTATSSNSISEPNVYQISPVLSQIDNIDSYHGSVYQLFKLSAFAYDGQDKHGALSYQSYYWDILSFAQIKTASNNFEKRIQPPVIDFMQLGKSQQANYIALLAYFKHKAYHLSIKNNYLELIRGKHKLKFELGFTCTNQQNKNNCLLRDSWSYEQNSFYYTLVLISDHYLSLWKSRYDQLDRLANQRKLFIDLKANTADQYKFSPVVILFKQKNNDLILSQLYKHHQLKWQVYTLGKNHQVKSINFNQVGKAIKLFPISKKLDLDVNGVFIYDANGNLWYLDRLFNVRKILHTNQNKELVSLSVIADTNQYWLFIFFEHQIEVFLLDNNFKVKSKKVAMRTHFKIASARASLGVVWLLTNFGNLNVYHWNKLNKKIFTTKANQCFFNTFTQFNVSCDDTEIKINAIVHPYQRQALKVVLPFNDQSKNVS
ncbi:hypothetical protein L3V82_03225 [Thiotrichales bacterium 19S3-7]|nr:hypothetical protein [Thiotrichales bacterium 19S3-7]MCF6801182.1 hypothetical protein [Thiotrichales bacterium 19S3-11]